MDVRAGIGDIRTLGRIVALLVALAGLAEGAAGRSFPVRWLVLTILRRAEPVARDFVARETGLLLPDSEGFAAAGNGPADALLLAAQFRIMAAALDVSLSLECLFGGRNARQRRVVRPGASRLRLPRLTFDGMDAPINDTS